MKIEEFKAAFGSGNRINIFRVYYSIAKKAIESVDESEIVERCEGVHLYIESATVRCYENEGKPQWRVTMDVGLSEYLQFVIEPPTTESIFRWSGRVSFDYSADTVEFDIEELYDMMFSDQELKEHFGVAFLTNEEDDDSDYLFDMAVFEEV